MQYIMLMLMSPENCQNSHSRLNKKLEKLENEEIVPLVSELRKESKASCPVGNAALRAPLNASNS